MKTYEVELLYYNWDDDIQVLENEESMYRGKENITVLAINESKARVEAVNHGIRKGNPNGTGIEILSIKEVTNEQSHEAIQDSKS